MLSACGDVSQDFSEVKVIGGRDAKKTDTFVEHLVFLNILNADGTMGVCSGVLISPVHVLTAAHCVYQADTVVAGFGTKTHEGITKKDLRISKWFAVHDFVGVETAEDREKNARNL